MIFISRCINMYIYTYIDLSHKMTVSRGGDGEFQALQACARASQELGVKPIGPPPMDGSAVEGELWLHVSEVPCLSCVGGHGAVPQGAAIL